MLRYVENYGEDLDGNRGVERVCYELEASDKEVIQSQIDEYISTNDIEDIEDTLVVHLLDPIDDSDVYLEVNIKEWR